MPHRKMDKAMRAKIFQPYDALKGFSELLREKERVVVPLKELSYDSLYELDWKIKSLKIGQLVKITYHDGKDYVSLEGIITNIDLNYQKTIKIVNRIISIQKIIKIE